MRDDRGLIQHLDRFRQPLDLTGLRWDNITPTDIDLFIEYKNKGYIIGEIKKTGNEMPLGQQIAFDRLTKDLNTLKPTLFFMVYHDIEDCDTPIPVSDLMLDGLTVKETIDKWIDEL